MIDKVLLPDMDMLVPLEALSSEDDLLDPAPAPSPASGAPNGPLPPQVDPSNAFASGQAVGPAADASLAGAAGAGAGGAHGNGNGVKPLGRMPGAGVEGAAAGQGSADESVVAPQMPSARG